jgi:cellulose synthase operon protein C
VKYLTSFSRSLTIAGFLAATLVGCGKDTPEALIDSAKAYSAKGDYKAASIQLRNVLVKQPDNGQARYLLGQALNEEMDYVTAEKELRKALEYGYTRDDTYAALARALLGQGKGKQAVAELNDKILSDPEAAASLKTDLGLAYISLGQLDEARAAFAAAIKAKPGYNRARVGQAILAATDKDVAGAMKIVDEILATAPALPEAMNLKADLLLAQNDAAGAIKVVEQVVKVQPNNFRPRYVLATLRIRENQIAEATAEIEALRKAAPKDPRVAFLEAQLAFRQGDAAKTRSAAQEVLRAMPDDVPSLFLAASADYRLRSFDSAADHLRRVLSQYPQSTEAQKLLISTYLESGHPERAQEVVDAALKRLPDDPKVLALAGATAVANNDLAKASRYYERAAALDKENVLTKTKLAQVRLATGDVDRAMKDLESASAMDAAGYQPDLALITAHVRRKEYDKALRAVGTLEKKQPNNPLTYNVKGVVYVASGDNKAARASFGKALELQYDYLPAARNLAGLDIVERNPEAARGRFEAIVAKSPKNDAAMIALANAQAATGASPKVVVATLERAVAANPASVNAKIELATRQLRSGDVKAALAVLQDAAASSPNDPRVLDLLAVAQQAAGDTNQAIATLNKLIALQPTAAEPLMRLATVHYAGKDYDASIQALRRALALKPGSTEVRKDIIAVQIAAGKFDDALAEARSIEKDLPKEAAGFVLEGDVYAAQKKWGQAASAYREALKRQSTGVIVTRLHAVLENDGKSADADALAANWIRDNPKDVVVRTYLAGRAAVDKNFKEAVKLYKAALLWQPQNEVILNNLAWTSMEAKEPGALDYAEKAYSIAPKNPAVLDTYGWILLQNGNVKRAVELLTEAVTLAPKNASMHLHLAKALIEAADKAAARKEIEALLRLEVGNEQRAEAQEILKGL